MTQGRPRFAIDSALGKELIEKLTESGNPDLLEDFFKVRLTWCGGYPLIHDRFVTYGAFDDLTRKLPSTVRYSLVTIALRLAETVKEQHFHAALFFLGDLIPDDGIYERPPGFSDSLLRLRLRAEKLGFLPNLECAWRSFVRKSYHLKTADHDFLRGYTPTELGLNTAAWLNFFPFPLINHVTSSLKKCNADPGALKEIIRKLGENPGERRLVYATRIQDTWFWAWRLPGKKGTAHLNRIVFLRQPKDGELGIGHWDIYKQFNERYKPEELSRRLLKIEFYPHDDLIPVPQLRYGLSEGSGKAEIEVVFVQFDGTEQRDQRCAAMLSRVVAEYQGMKLTVIDSRKADSRQGQRMAELGCVALPRLVVVKNGQIFTSIESYGDENSVKASLNLAIR